MSAALELGQSVYSGAVVTPDIIHDPGRPLVIGHPEAGEFGMFTFNNVTRRVEITCASDSQNALSQIVFGADGSFSINGFLLPSFEGVDAAVALAQAAATSAAASATVAGNHANTAANALTSINAAVAAWNVSADAKMDQLDDTVEEVDQLVVDATAALANSQTLIDTVEELTGEVATALDEAKLRANAPDEFTFEDGSKSAGSYARAAARSATLSRIAVVRSLVTADFPEVFAPGNLFKRTRCIVSSPVVMQFPANIWNDPAGEAWATFRLEKTGTGSVTFEAVGGGTTPASPSVLAHGRIRQRSTGASSTMVASGTVAVPNVTNGKLVVIGMVGFNTATDVTGSIALSDGLTATLRRSLPGAITDIYTPNFMIWDAPLVGFSASDVDVSLTFGPNANFIVGAIFVVEAVGAAAPIVGPYGVSAGNASSIQATLPGAALGGLVLSMAGMRGGNTSGAGHSSFSANTTKLASGTTYGLPVGGDAQDFRNCVYGYGSGVVNTAGNFAVSAGFANAFAKCSIISIHYPPTAATIDGVNLIARGGRLTMSENGAEATAWFVNDNRTIYLDIPTP